MHVRDGEAKMARHPGAEVAPRSMPLTLVPSSLARTSTSGRIATLRRIVRQYREDLLNGAYPSDAIVSAYRAWTHVERGQH